MSDELLFGTKSEVYVFGDTLIDHLTVVRPERFCPEDPHAVIYRKCYETEFYGGAANVAASLAGMDVDYQFISQACKDEHRVPRVFPLVGSYADIAAEVEKRTCFIPGL